MFWAVIVATAEANAEGGSMAKPMSRSTTPTEAEATTPMVLTITVMIKKEILTRASCTASGVPTSRIRFMAWESGLKCRRPKSKGNPRLAMINSDRKKLKPWAAMVARAAPAA